MGFGALEATFTVAANSITNPTVLALSTGSAVANIGDLVYVVVGEQIAVTATAVTDNLGNSYASTQTGTDAGTATGIAFFSRVTVAGTITAINVAATASTNNVACVAALFEGPFKVSPRDANPTNITSDVTSPFTCPASGTLTNATELIIGWGVATGNAVWTASAPNILADQIATQAVLKVALGYQTVTATTTTSPAFTGTNPTEAVLGTTSFMRDLMIAQYDWPRPPVVIPVTNRDYSFPTSLALKTFVQPPFFQTSWPPPMQSVRPNQTPGYIYTKPPVQDTNTYMPSVVTDWGAPPPPVSPAPQQAGGFNLPLNAVTQAPFRQNEWPPPQAPLPIAKGRVAGLSPNQMQAPFRQNDWPNARTIAGKNDGWIFSFSPDQLLPPFRQTDWPAPGFATKTGAWITPRNLPLLNDTTQVPFRQNFWPPPAALSPPATFTQPRNLALLIPSDQFPFNQYSWPLPAPAERPKGYTFVQQIVADTNTYMPSVVVDWGSPTPPVPPAPFVYPRSPVLSAAPAAMPFNKFDWPNQREIPRPIPLYTWINGLPPIQYVFRELQIVRAKAIDPPIHTQPLGSSLAVLTPLGAKPFSQSNWPTAPLIPAPAPFVYPRSPALDFTAPMPFRQSDWPNQRPALPLSFSITQAPSLSLTAMPFRQTNWPSPLGQAIQPKSYTLPLNVALVTTVQGVPFRQTDWPNEKRAARPQVFNAPNVTIQISPPPPGVTAFEWLQRARRRGRR